MACRRLSLSATTCGLLLIPLLLPGLFVVLAGPSADQVGAQELRAKEAYLSGQRPTESPRSSASAASTNQAPKPAGKMGFVPASPTPRDNTPKLPRSVANPVARRAVAQPPKYAVSAGDSPEAPRTEKFDTQSVAARPVPQRQPKQSRTVAQPKPITSADEGPVTTLPPPVHTRPLNLPEPFEESQPSRESDEAPETIVTETRPSQFRTIDEPADEEMPPFDEPKTEPVQAQTPTRNSDQKFLDADADEEDSDELMLIDDEPRSPMKLEAAIREEIPLVVPQRAMTLEALVPVSPKRPNTREIDRNPVSTSGQRSAEAPRESSNQASANQAAKPSSKLSFVPGTPSTRDGVPNDPRSVANPLTRRAVPQPPKFAAAAPPVHEAPQTQRPDPRSIVSRPAKPQPNTLVSKPRAPQQSKQSQVSEELSIPLTTTAKTEVLPMLPEEAPVFEEPIVKRPETGVVQLYFDDDPAEETIDEIMELDRHSAPALRENDIRPVAAEGEVIQKPAQVQTANQDTSPDNPKSDNTKSDIAKSDNPKSEKDPMAKVMADLRPVREVDVALAVKLPMAGKNDSENVREPDDQALAILRHRKPFNIFAVSREPWMPNRDSYPFFHNPLWFEDPNLERCGRGRGLFTTAVSAVHFSANIPILPYRFTAEKPWSCVRTLPDCTVCERFGCEAYLPPWSLSAAAVQAAATVGIIYAVP